MKQIITTIAGKSIRTLARLRGGGSALPGLVTERIDPNFIKRTLADLPYGTVVVSGTNGKTTTTKMLVEILQGQGLKVFTNRTGSNFTRGIAAALIKDINYRGRLNADIAVIELDEAYAIHFIKQVHPQYSLILNVMRDQLDRFGEIDNTAKLLHVLAKKTTGTVVLNANDPRLSSPSFTSDLTASLNTFKVASNLLSLYPNDDNLYGDSNNIYHAHNIKAQATLLDVSKQIATIEFLGKKYSINFKLKGMYNFQNALGAILMASSILKNKLVIDKMIADLEQVNPAFGRGETLIINNQPCELVLVKNPSGFRLGLNSFDSKNYSTMIAINDMYADGRDLSWLWDVSFESLIKTGVSVVCGTRAYDMALRLQYDEVKVNLTETNIKKAVSSFIKNTDTPKRIYCTYTAMLAIRKILSGHTKVTKIS